MSARPRFAAIYQQIADEVVRRARRPPPGSPMVYAVPGHPLVGEAAVRRAGRRARARAAACASSPA